MAFMVKNVNKGRSVGSQAADQGFLNQWVHVVRGTGLVPASTTEMLFRVFGGKILVHLLVATATVAFDATDPVMKVTGKQLSAAGVAVGTAVDIASTVNLASLEIGGTANVLGSGAALVKNNAGAVLSTLGRVEWVMPQGEIYITTGATNLLGFAKWDLWYQPLDEGAFVVAQPLATAII